jgi:protoporphyrin/coproporphyrin ferrochelatase
VKQALGICLINLGTPDAPDSLAVGKYLREFLMDPLVVDIPWVFRWFLVNIVIVPKRSEASSLLYKKIWSDAKSGEGSPLLHHTLNLASKLQTNFGSRAVVVPAMRYGSPSIESALKILKEANVSRILACPLYPQYSLAATLSSVEKVKEVVANLDASLPVQFLKPFYQEAAYLDAVARVSAPYLSEPHDLVIFSFHGLPERQIKKCDQSRNHCLKSETCCDFISHENTNCYRAQSYFTARQLAKRLGITRYEVGFQSRLGRSPWIKPHTDAFYRELPKKGIKKLIVLSPSFVADCLETLEEIQLRGRDEFLRHGGESLKLVPSLNADDIWVDSLEAMLTQRFLIPSETSVGAPVEIGLNPII